MISVLLADDEVMVRAGLRFVLEAEENIEVVGEASDGEEAVQLTLELEPDVLLMDIRMPHVDGIEASRRLAAADASAHVLLLTTFDQDDYLFRALRAGTSGFLLKSAPPEELIRGIRTVAAGDALLAPAVTRRVIASFASTPEPPDTSSAALIEELTSREREVLRQLARGLSNAEIARELVVSDATIKTHVARVLMKLGVRDRVQAVVLAYQTGLVSRDDR